MRVKVSYTTDVDSVPEEVGNIVNTVANRFSKTAFELNELTVGLIQNPDENLISASQTLDGVRKLLATLDLKLADCQNILTAFVEYKNNPTSLTDDTLSLNEEEQAVVESS
tara:strand:+ start:27495 stop:27827 length:333 start_codon:yes stop_codon:yes gene_type:complete